MMQKLARQLPADATQDSVVARASMEVLVLQKTTELSGLDSRMMIYLEAHELMRTSSDSVTTMPHSSLRIGPHGHGPWAARAGSKSFGIRP